MDNDNKTPVNNNECDSDLKSLISNAIENKKILDESNSPGRTANIPIPTKPQNSDKKSDSDKSDKPKKKNSWSKKKKTGVALGIVFIVFVLIIALIVGIFFHYTGMLDRNKDNKLNYGKAPVNSSELTDDSDTFDAKKKEEELRAQLNKQSSKISSEDVTNILLIGEDIRDTEEESRGNTDVMMIISINTKNKTVTMTSLMRDMYIYMAQFDEGNRLNSAYWHGGCEYLEQCIEDYFGIEIDRYARVNFYSFIDIVETVGGIDMEVSKEEAEGMKAPMGEQNKYLKNKKGTDYIDMDNFKGKSDTDKVKLHLNGNQALAFARLRYVGNSDYERTERQRRVISEIITEAKKLNLVQLDKLLSTVLPEVNTDLTDGEIANLLLNAFDYMDYDIQQLRIPADGYFTNEVIYGMDVLNPDFTANSAFIQSIVYGSCKNVDEAIAEYQKENATAYDTNYNNNYNYDYNNNYNYNYNYGY